MNCGFISPIIPVGFALPKNTSRWMDYVFRISSEPAPPPFFMEGRQGLGKATGQDLIEFVLFFLIDPND